MTSRPKHYSHISHIITECGLFHDLPSEVMESMFDHFQCSSWEAGCVVNPHRQEYDVYLIINGRAKMDYTDQVTGKDLTLSVLGEGDLFDIMSFISQCTNDVVTTALDKLTVLNIPSDTVKDWMHCYPQFNTNFLSYLGIKMCELESKAASLATANSSTRLARLIFQHTNSLPLKNGIHSVQLIHDLTNEGLAKMIGSSRQVVNKHLQALRSSDVLCPRSKDLVVTDLDKLKHYSL